MDEILNLPKSMQERALWARNEFINNAKNSQIDDNLLVWVFNKEDKLWYSILGNYSRSSPSEKRIRAAEYEKRLEEKQKQQIIKAEEYYERVLYYSKIRIMVLERDNYTCQKCGKIGNNKFHVHHILKKNDNGSDCLDNLITCCPSCHKKSDYSEYNPKW